METKEDIMSIVKKMLIDSYVANDIVKKSCVWDNKIVESFNYIRYWQASGESIKTSVRTKTRMGQLVQEGHFRGGTVPYGYKFS